jgi:hypothetical protein
MTLTMARDLGTLGIRATPSPRAFATGLTQGISDEGEAVLTPRRAFRGGWGGEEYAKLALAIVENPMLNGGTIRLDGGQRFAPK